MMFLHKRVSSSLIFSPHHTRNRVILQLGESIMKKYPLEELVLKWEREELTTEQAIGQLFLWLVNVVERILRLEAHQRRADRQKKVG
jgi:hypothetical protein